MSSRRFMIAYRPGSTKNSRMPLGSLNDVKDAFTKTFSGFRWNSNVSGKSTKDAFAVELGIEKQLTDQMSQGLPGFKKISDRKVKAEAGHIIELGMNDDCVHQAIMEIGRVDLGRLAELCKQHAWRLEDPDVADEEVDLDDPERWLVDHYA